MGWAAVCWVVFFWGLGTVPLLDPDEAHYAQITREMLAAGEWVVPLLEGQQHVDKPVLFHWVQGAAFGLLGESEVAARVPPVLASLLLLAVTWWCGAHLFGPQVGERAALMFATMPATFALSGIAIFDMLFTLFLFGGLACLVIGALEQRAGLQYGGFVLVAGAVLTKGPAAVVLMVIAAVLCLLHPATRPIALRIRWLAGLAIGLALTGPWFLVLWHRVGDAFVDQYVFQHNLSLFGAPLYRHERNPFFYARIFFTAFLPWSPIVIGRVIDLARGWRTHRTVGTGEVVLWAWAITVFGFFSLSWFKLDTYVYPAVPAICLLASHAWQQERARSHWSAVRVVLVLVAIAMVGIGIAKALLIFQLDLPLPRTVAVVPAAVDRGRRCVPLATGAGGPAATGMGAGARGAAAHRLREGGGRGVPAVRGGAADRRGRTMADGGDRPRRARRRIPAGEVEGEPPVLRKPPRRRARGSDARARVLQAIPRRVLPGARARRRPRAAGGRRAARSGLPAARDRRHGRSRPQAAGVGRRRARAGCAGGRRRC
jgi:hypothetical protein